MSLNNNPPGRFTKPAPGYAAGSGRLLGLILDSVPTWRGEPMNPPLSAEEVEAASEELDRRASAKCSEAS